MNRQTITKQTLKYVSYVFLITSLIGMIAGFPFNSGTKTPSQNWDRATDNPLAGASMNTLIYTDNLTYSHINRGENIILSGYVEWFNGSALIGLEDYPIFPVLNGIAQNGEAGADNLTVFTDSNGNFSFIYQVPLDYDFLQNLTIFVDVLESATDNVYVGPLSYQTAPFNLDITAVSQISLITNNEDDVLTNDVYNALITLNDGNSDPIETDTLILFKNGNVSNVVESNVTTDATGQVTLNVTQEADMDSVGIYYPGFNFTISGEDSYYQIAPSNFTVNIPRITSIHASLDFVNVKNDSETGVYTGENLQILGSFWMNNDTNSPLVARGIRIILSDGSTTVTLGPFTTDATGSIDQTFDLAANGFTQNGTLSVSVEVYNNGLVVVPSAQIQNQGSMSITIFDEPQYFGNQADPGAIEGTTFTWTGLIIPGIIVVVLVGGIVLFQRFRMEKTHRKTIKLRKVDLEKFITMNMLYKVGRRRESIAYSYKIFADMINEKYGLVRAKNQTLREFAILCVTKYGLDPLRTYPYIALVENVTYGGYDLDPESYERATKVFARIFQEITGTVLNFALEVTEATEKLEGVTLKIGE